MEWQDEGIIIGGRRYGESSLIVEVMTRAHGRHPGLVRGGRSKRLQPLLQPGNAVAVTWRARLEDQLGTFALEATRLHAAELMTDPARLHGLNLLLAHLRLLAEREPHEPLYELAALTLDALGAAGERAARLLVTFELALLSDCGFGLDLERCAATGSRDDLVYVSPKSARAVSRNAGAPYHDKLLALPAFLHGDAASAIAATDIADAFRLTGFFLERHLFEPRGIPMPAARDAFLRELRHDVVPPVPDSSRPSHDLP